MITSGKRALRKKRFTEPLSAGYQPRFELLPSFEGKNPSELSALGHQLGVKYADVRQVPVPLGEVEAVADHEAVRDLEADVADGHVDLAPVRLGEEGADLEARRLAGLEVSHQIGERETGVDDVLDHQDVAPLDVDVEVLEDADDARRVGLRAVARDRHEVDLAGDRQRAHQVSHEEDGALEDADQQQVTPGVVGGDLFTELEHARPQAILVDEDLRDVALELSLRHARQ